MGVGPFFGAACPRRIGLDDVQRLSENASAHVAEAVLFLVVRQMPWMAAEQSLPNGQAFGQESCRECVKSAKGGAAAIRRDQPGRVRHSGAGPAIRRSA